MKKPWINDDEVRRHVPKGRELPARFADFIQAGPPYRVEWNDLDAYGLKPSATSEAVPFMRLPDGALLALWYQTANPAVVLIGGHGELKVIARDFDDFLKAVAGRCTGLSDLDDAEVGFHVPGLKGKPSPDALPTLQQAFEEWFKRHTSLLEPVVTPEAEDLRRRVVRIAEAMIGAGLSKVYSPASAWWSMDFRVERRESALAVVYLDYGQWYPVPESFGLVDEVESLLELVQNKARSRYDLHVQCSGIVSVDGDRELVLVPPKPTDRTGAADE